MIRRALMFLGYFFLNSLGMRCDFLRPDVVRELPVEQR